MSDNRRFVRPACRRDASAGCAKLLFVKQPLNTQRFQFFLQFASKLPLRLRESQWQDSPSPSCTGNAEVPEIVYVIFAICKKRMSNERMTIYGLWLAKLMDSEFTLRVHEISPGGGEPAWAP